MEENGLEQTPVSPVPGLNGHFGASLAPALIDASGGRLSELHFFMTDWQQGGAATAYGVYRFDDGSHRDVVVKAPVGPVEHRVTTSLANVGAPTPGVACSGLELGAYDLAWLVLEKLPGEPISRDFTKRNLLDLIDATARYYKAAELAFGPPTEPPPPVDWAELVEKARRSVRENALPDEQRWKESLKSVAKLLDSLVTRWQARSTRYWRHGDLHPGNAMRRPDDSPWGLGGCILFDLDRVTPGHWVSDALYLERIHWGKPELLHGEKPVKLLAKAMKKHECDPGDDYHELATIRRILTASCTPVFLDREGHSKHLAGTLDVLERSLAAV